MDFIRSNLASQSCPHALRVPATPHATELRYRRQLDPIRVVTAVSDVHWLRP